MGRFLLCDDVNIVGYYDIDKANAALAAEFTNSNYFENIEELVDLSDTIFIATSDDMIIEVWNSIKELPIRNKIVCHFSGSLSSDVFSDSKFTGANVCSLHPMMVFNNKYSSYRNLDKAFFTIEGDKEAVNKMKILMSSKGAEVCCIDKDCKVLYHTAASVLSNHMVGLMDLGYSLLQRCGFTRNQARQATSQLVSLNLQNILKNDCISSLTGSVERNDRQTIKRHLGCLAGNEKLIYISIAQRLVELSGTKNSDVDYSDIKRLLRENLQIDKFTEEQ